MKIKLTPAKTSERKLAEMREYGRVNKVAIAARKKAKRLLADPPTPERKEYNRAATEKSRQKKDPVAYAATRLKMALIEQGHCKKGHRPEERGEERNCKACAVAAEAKYRASNRAKCVAFTNKRRAQKLQAIPVWATDFDDFVFEEAADLAIRRFKATGFKWHVDHIVPLQSSLVCGLHVHSNIRVIPALENSRKGNRFWPNMP